MFGGGGGEGEAESFGFGSGVQLRRVRVGGDAGEPLDFILKNTTFIWANSERTNKNLPCVTNRRHLGSIPSSTQVVACFGHTASNTSKAAFAATRTATLDGCESAPATSVSTTPPPPSP